MAKSFVIASMLVASGLLAQTLQAAQQAEAEVETQLFKRWLIHTEVFMGAGFPVGSMNLNFDPSFMVGIRGEFGISPNMRGGIEVSYHAFDSEGLTVADNQGVIGLSLLGKFLDEWGPYRPFALLGVGVYSSKEDDGKRRWDAGFQLGAGTELPVSEHLAVTVGSTLQVVPRDGDPDKLFWIDAYLGFVFRQP